MKSARLVRACASCTAFFLFALTLSSCGDWLSHVDLAPDYRPPQYVVLASWHGASPFVEARPSDGELRLDWWPGEHETMQWLDQG